MLKVINLFKHSGIKDHLLVQDRAITYKKILTDQNSMSLVKHIPEKIVGLFNCSDNRCMLHNNGYINSCKEFTFKVKHGFFTWKYNRSFNCNS